MLSQKMLKPCISRSSVPSKALVHSRPHAPKPVNDGMGSWSCLKYARSTVESLENNLSLPSPASSSSSKLDVDRLVSKTANSSLFTPTFKAALAQALQRGEHGKEFESLLEDHQEGETIGDQEQMLLAALQVSRNNLSRLQSIRANAEKLAEAEARQAERLTYALSKARSDAEYYRNVERMSEQVSEESRECKAKYAASVIIGEVERLEANMVW